MPYRIIDTQTFTFVGRAFESPTEAKKAYCVVAKPDRYIVRHTDYCDKNAQGDVMWLIMDPITGATVAISKPLTTEGK